MCHNSESQSQPGDYALSVQTGNMVWTGLILHTEHGMSRRDTKVLPHSAAGYQLGTKATICFDELTDLIKHVIFASCELQVNLFRYYAQNKFMNDAFGAPLILRLPYNMAAV